LQSILKLWKRYSVLGVKPTTEADEMLMSRYARIKRASAIDVPERAVHRRSS
jgi:hypothetical protein